MLTIYVDGATAGTAHVGVAAVARSEQGYFLGWRSRQLGRMTNNEAEYRALLLALELARGLEARMVEIVTDSEVVARQMEGRSRVLSPRLQLLHRQATEAARFFERVTFRHVPRAQNRLADALAAEALAGQTVEMAPGRGVREWALGTVRGRR